MASQPDWPVRWPAGGCEATPVRGTLADVNCHLTERHTMSHTIVLVHGAFADSTSWNGVIDRLQGAGHSTVAVANPLRGLASDAEAVSDVVRTIDGPVVLAAHSYGGAVISNVSADAGDITGLVYADGFAPDAGESAFTLAGKFPGSTTGDSVRPIPRSDGTTDLVIAPELFHQNFCADVPEAEAARMAVTQRPATQEALTEESGEPLWKQVPSWFLIGEADLIIPPELQRFMAERANAKRTVQIPGASHVISVAHPDETADVILEACAVPAAA
jgi:pimeloyl-ACP methyl ester carboxylesterase